MTTTDPLLDVLFRPTSLSPAVVSAAPVRQVGTRARAGNAMSRTRLALLAGARRAVEADGTRITMSQVAAAAGVAKATLYNHMRTREAVLGALLEHEIGVLIEAADGRPLAEALAEAAASLSQHSVLRALARREPAALAGLARMNAASAGWRRAREAVGELLRRHERGGTETVLRWLGSFILNPAGPVTIAADLDVLLAGLPGAPARHAEARPA